MDEATCIYSLCCDLGVDIVLLDEIGLGNVVGRVTSGSASEGGDGSGSAGGGALRFDLVRAMVGYRGTQGAILSQGKKRLIICR